MRHSKKICEKSVQVRMSELPSALVVLVPCTLYPVLTTGYVINFEPTTKRFYEKWINSAIKSTHSLLVESV